MNIRCTALFGDQRFIINEEQHITIFQAVMHLFN